MDVDFDRVLPAEVQAHLTRPTRIVELGHAAQLEQHPETAGPNARPSDPQPSSIRISVAATLRLLPRRQRRTPVLGGFAQEREQQGDVLEANRLLQDVSSLNAADACAAASTAWSTRGSVP
jgi:hypothetical protein